MTASASFSHELALQNDSFRGKQKKFRPPSEKKDPTYVGTSTSFKLGVLHTLELGKSIGAQSFL